MSNQGQALKRISFSLIIVAAVLVGCSSFNNSFNHYALPPVDKQPEPDAPDDVKLMPEPAAPAAVTPVQPAPPTPVTSPCDVSPYAVDVPVPEIPTRELQAATDVGGIEKIERRHINDLRQYIADVRKAQRQAKMRFYQKCSVISK